MLQAIRRLWSHIRRPSVNHQKFKLAAPGTGVLIFRQSTANSESLEVLLSMRSRAAGAGYGYTGGGFVECGDVAALPVGRYLQCADEAYRESGEENGGFEAVLGREDFFVRAQPIATFNARSADINVVHACTVFACGVSDEEWQKCLATEATQERSGMLRVVKLTWKPGLSRRSAEDFIELSDGASRITAEQFFHQHEIAAYGALAWHAEYGKLW